MKKRKKKKKIPLKKLLKRLSKKADKALGDYIKFLARKESDKCPLCFKNPIQCSFHFISRRRKILRWSESNVWGMCTTCNFVERNWPDLSRAWYIKRYGVAQYLLLVETSKESFEPTVEFLEATILKFSSKLVKLKEYYERTKS